LLQKTEIQNKQISDEINFLINHLLSTFSWAIYTVICYTRSAFAIYCQPSPHIFVHQQTPQPHRGEA